MDPSEKACIEVLRPKTVPDGLIALGTISQVFESHIRIQIPDGVTCIIDQQNVNKVYKDSLDHSHQTHETGCSPPKLSQLFKRGQQYACKVIGRVARKGYTDAQNIIATLDPTAIYEDCVPATLLAIDHVPIQCAVQSIEDHIYQLDIGFKGLIGSLSMADAEDYCRNYNGGRKLSVGQVIRCNLKKRLILNPEIRVVHLTLNEKPLDSGCFRSDKITEYLLTERCILPGSRSFLTVMRVLNEGLIVNFMNEFSGFVGMNHLKEDWHSPKKNYKISDHIDCSVLYYNNTTRTFALSLKPPEKSEKVLNKLLSQYHPGRFIEDAEVVYKHGAKAVYFKIDKKLKGVATTRDALEVDSGTMTKDELILSLDSTYPEGSKHRCRIKSINYADQILVVGLKTDFLGLEYLSSEELKAGDMVDATVKKHVKDGIIVTFGLNFRGLILNQDLQDYVSKASYRKYPIGKKIPCRVLKKDSRNQQTKLYLTNKKDLLEPQITILSSYDKEWKGKFATGRVSSIGHSGMILEFFNNVKGFLPNRFASSVGLKRSNDLFKVGQVLTCVVYKIDPTRPTLSLSMIPYETIMKMKSERKLAKKAAAEIRQESKIAFKTSRQVEQSDLKKSSNIEKVSKKVKAHAKRQPHDENEVRFVSSDSENDSKKRDYVFDLGDSSGEDQNSKSDSDDNANQEKIKIRIQKSEEALQHEKLLREAENNLMDSERAPQSIPDFERLILKNPNSAETWTKYSKFFLNNIETEKARIICRRALKTINFRLEREKLRIWLHLIKIEAKFGGSESLHQVIDEASQTNDRISLYQGAVKVLTNCGELHEADRLLEMMVKIDNKSVDIWMNYIEFIMDARKDMEKARSLFARACKSVDKSDLINLKSRFGRLEFKSGDVERGKTVFENLLNDNPKRTDLWIMYEAMIRKFGTRQLDTDEVKQQNEQTLKRLSDSIQTVSKKLKKR